VDSAGDLDLVAVRRELREERQRRELLQAHAVSGVLAAVLMASWVWPLTMTRHCRGLDLRV
jgi:hypothetical protein